MAKAAAKQEKLVLLEQRKAIKLAKRNAILEERRKEEELKLELLNMTREERMKKRMEQIEHAHVKKEEKMYQQLIAASSASSNPIKEKQQQPAPSPSRSSARRETADDVEKDDERPQAQDSKEKEGWVQPNREPTPEELKAHINKHTHPQYNWCYVPKIVNFRLPEPILRVGEKWSLSSPDGKIRKLVANYYNPKCSIRRPAALSLDEIDVCNCSPTKG